MIKLICVLALVFAAQCKLGVLVPPPAALTVEQGKCLLTNKYEAIVLRASLTSGDADPKIAANYKAAVDAGFKDIELSISPCLPCEPVDQVKAMAAAIKGINYARIWITIDVPGWREFKAFNQVYIQDMIGQLKSLGKKIGILSSKFQWEDNFGADFSGASGLELMFEALDKDPSFKSFKAFGGWRKPYAKHYNSGADLCSSKMELIFKE